jgi:hypothetical protein
MNDLSGEKRVRKGKRNRTNKKKKKRKTRGDEVPIIPCRISLRAVIQD